MDRDTAQQALADIDLTRERALTLRTYAHAGPIFAAWGVAWFVMNLTNHFDVPFAFLFGAAAIASATAVSIIFGKAGRRGPDTPATRRRSNLGSAMTGIAIFGLLVLIAPTDRLLANAVISWLAASSYAVAGLWFGARITLLGLVLAAVVIAAWFFARDSFELVMGIAGGGVLVTTGLWLWRS
ncbi:hypothetical protein HF680_15735 [Brevundimonas sp. WCHBH090558]|uniref:hypothetical protein n=1 Tax=Brevundimonas huaxiensis TaxID=2725493 RepID=UPI001627C8DE|nr:hypothetical protein [Brevundimonas huaxiensis]MBC1184080.1 hypothetical protein [Brevundimonas huaxiensis]